MLAQRNDLELSHGCFLSSSARKELLRSDQVYAGQFNRVISVFRLYDTQHMVLYSYPWRCRLIWFQIPLLPTLRTRSGLKRRTTDSPSHCSHCLSSEVGHSTYLISQIRITEIPNVTSILQLRKRTVHMFDSVKWCTLLWITIGSGIYEHSIMMWPITVKSSNSSAEALIEDCHFETWWWGSFTWSCKRFCKVECPDAQTKQRCSVRPSHKWASVTVFP